jgi:hypothetical protein
MNRLFHSSWGRAWQGLLAQGNGHVARDAVIARYSEPHRVYHTLQHLDECLRLFERVRDSADHPHEVEMALWLQDAIYDLNGSDNEARSALLARSELAQAGVRVDAAARVKELVLITKHSAAPRNRDEKVMIDIDLSRALHLTGPPWSTGRFTVEAGRRAARGGWRRWHLLRPMAHGDVCVAHGRVPHRKLEHSAEHHSPAAGVPPVEAEHELVEVLVQMRLVDGTLVGAENPPLGQ